VYAYGLAEPNADGLLSLSAKQRPLFVTEKGIELLNRELELKQFEAFKSLVGIGVIFLAFVIIIISV